jgi:hypothetical protein
VASAVWIAVYECATNPDLLEERIDDGIQRFEKIDYVLVEMCSYMGHESLSTFGFEIELKRICAATVPNELEASGVQYGAASVVWFKIRQRIPQTRSSDRWETS